MKGQHELVEIIVKIGKLIMDLKALISKKFKK